MRLDHYLSTLGYGTRQITSEYIKKGLIKVNDQVILSRAYQIKENDNIKIDSSIKPFKNLIYLAFNKPEDYLSSTKSTNNYPSIYSLLNKEYQNSSLSILGRLDNDTTGLIIFTNDSALIRRFHYPSKPLGKTYLVTFSGDISLTNLNLFKEGITLLNGYKTKPSEIKIKNKQELEMTIYEGKYHEIKKMFGALNLKVITLKRISIGRINLGNLKEKEVRKLTSEEINYLKNI